MFDNLIKQIDHWYYGRLDIKYDTFEKLIQGKDFKIIEMNGIISEPTHIYDPNNITYVGALKSIKEHWKILFQISKKNHDLFKIPYPKLKPYFKELLWLRSHSKKLIRLNKLE
ncbi:MAG: D-alanine--D-alanine ligase, partial [Bacteroidia bacterium]|nr:D-alanine--D-alanine ligase [Bacteroidia bacterium]